MAGNKRYTKTDIYVKAVEIGQEYYLCVPVYVADDGEAVLFPLMAVRELPPGARLVSVSVERD